MFTASLCLWQSAAFRGSFQFKVMRKIFIVLSHLACLIALPQKSIAAAKDTITYEQMGGVYYAYHFDSTAVRTPVPDGYSPFYISHFGRHGSRWLPSDNRYQWVIRQFADTTNLTPLGRDVRGRLLKIWDDAKGRGGDLTALGARQHADIAGRMYNEWGEVFRDDAEISARSSVVGRCVMSMTSFLLKLQSLNPELRITAESNRRFMPYIAYSSPNEDSLIARTPRVIKASPDRLMSSLFIEPDKITEKMNLLSELHCIASDMQNVCIGISLYDIFTPDEMRAVYDASNLNMWTCNSRNPQSGDIPVRSAASLWRNIVEAADSAIANGTPRVTLRFGHDTSLYRLLTLLGLYADEQRMDRIIPMAANLIIVFYKNAEGKIIVKFMHNEREICLPIDSDIAPFYYWDDVKQSYNIHQ